MVGCGMKGSCHQAVLWTGLLTALCFSLSAQEPKDEGFPVPTLSNVPYGGHERQVLDIYRAESDQPTPLLFYIHGGGWVKGDKKDVKKLVGPLLDAGISVVSINYRYSWQAQQAGVEPPVSWPVHDATRALQFVRSKAAEWNIDKERIAASGGSAGGCTSLWLAFHDDMADPSSSDPVARESTRLFCVAVHNPQTTLDPKLMKEWTPNSRYGGHAFGLMDPDDLKTRDTRFDEFLAQRDKLLPWIEEYSPMNHADAGDPPVYMIYDRAPGLGKDQKDPTHTANFGVKLKELLDKFGVPCELVYPGAEGVRHQSIEAFLIDMLKGEKSENVIRIGMAGDTTIQGSKHHACLVADILGDSREEDIFPRSYNQVANLSFYLPDGAPKPDIALVRARE